MRVKAGILNLFLILFSVTGYAVPPAWSHTLDGAITDLDVARDTGDILISTIYDGELGRGANRVVGVDALGTQLWKVNLKTAVRAQGISRDGRLGVVSTHEDELIGIDGRKGKVLWKTHGTCKPYVLASVDRIVCWHDDDAESETGFEVFNFKGKRVSSFPITTDSLAFAVSPDESRFAISLMGSGGGGGEIVVFDSATLSRRWGSKVKGGVLKLAFAPGPKSVLATLSGGSKEKKQELAVYTDSGVQSARGVLDQHFEHLDFAGNASRLVLYTNGSAGQAVSCWDAHTLKKISGIAAPKSGNYFAQAVGLRGFSEGAFVSAWQKELGVFSCSGTKLWSSPRVKEEGAFLYGFRENSNPLLLIAAFEDGVLEAYRPELNADLKLESPERPAKIKAPGSATAPKKPRKKTGR